MTILGGSGFDTLYGGRGADVLKGGDGNDILEGGPGEDTILGEAGNDTIVWRSGDGADSTIDGGAGSNRLQVIGGDGPDAMTIVETSSGLNATINGVSFSASSMQILDLLTNGGNDNVTLSVGPVVKRATVDLGAGDDLFDGRGSSIGLLVSGGSGFDTIYGGSGADLLSGGDGNDILEGGPGADTILGEAGNDTIVWRIGDGADRTVDGGAGSNRLQVIGGEEADEVTIVETSSGLNATINGVSFSALSIQILDLLTHGGNDNVTLSVGAVVKRATVDLGAGDDLFDGRGSSIGLLVNGGIGDDILFGGSGADLLRGGEGDDWLIGGTGRDRLEGGAGADTFVRLEETNDAAEDTIVDFSEVEGDSIVMAVPPEIVMTSAGGDSDEKQEKPLPGWQPDWLLEFVLNGAEKKNPNDGISIEL
jgi:Ca2+-binding RTX toxin-like protein